MIYKLYSLDSIDLKNKPETGMGYQVIEAARFGETAIKRYVVYNSELAVNDDAEFTMYKTKMFSQGYSKTLKESSELILKTDSIRVLNKSELKQNKTLKFSESKTSKNRHAGGKGAKDNQVEKADGKEIFVRISAYEDDKRIDFQNKKLKNGSFTTIEKDYNECVSVSDDPIDRYALPNDEDIRWAFYIKPLSDNTLQRGIVQPAFDHDGGGIETYFENGTSNDTYLLKKPYGK